MGYRAKTGCWGEWDARSPASGAGDGLARDFLHGCSFAVCKCFDIKERFGLALRSAGFAATRMDFSEFLYQWPMAASDRGKFIQSKFIF